MRFDQLAHTVSSTISTLTREKKELEARAKELSELLEQERSIAKQREKLFSSNQGESEQHQTELNELRAKLKEHDALAKQKIQSISTLENELMTTRQRVEDQENKERVRLSESATLETDIAGLEKTLTLVTAERDALKNKLHTKENEDSTIGLKLSREEMKTAAKTLDLISKKLEGIEQKVLKAQTANVPEPDIFQQA